MSSSRACLSYVVLGCLLGMLACGDQTPPNTGGDTDAAPPIGSLSLAWEITDGAGPLSCAALDAEVVRVQALPSEGGSATIDTIDCNDGAGAIPVPEGVFDVEVTLISPLGQLGEAFTQDLVQVRAGQTESLGTVTFTVSPQGNVELFIDTDALGGNCEPAPDGSDISQMRLEMRNGAGTCVPTTFEIAAGATRTGDTYESDCAGALFDCIENDQLVRAVGVGSGPNTLTIVGIEPSGRECYRRISQFDVPGGDLTASLPTQRLGPNPDEPGCVPGPAPDGGLVDAGLPDASPIDAGP